jgi:EAL domain-containing protein (putative c-di-GMP-specific phosphodiesterase class I)/PAS domain-containing protein
MNLEHIVKRTSALTRVGLASRRALAPDTQQPKRRGWPFARPHRLADMQQELDRERSLYADSEARRLQSERALGLLLQHLTTPVLYVDAGQVCRSHNAAFERALDLASDRIDARPLRELMGETSYGCIKEHVEQALGGKGARLPQVFRGKDGQILLFDGQYVPVYGRENQVAGFYVLLLGDGERQHAEAASWAGPDDVTLLRKRPDDESAIEGAGDAPDTAVANDARRAQLLNALRAGDFCLFQQAIVPIHARDSEPASHEILVRLRGRGKRLIHPAAFMGAAQDIGIMRELDRWVVENALRRYAGRVRQPGSVPALSLHINVSRDSMLDESFPAFVRTLTSELAVPTRSICFEISESDAIAHRMEAICCAYALNMVGCLVAVDRFGRESRSFSAITGMPIDFIKIDGSVVGKISRDSYSHTKTRTIVKVAQSIGARTIAERVEDEDTLRHLKNMGVDFVQGFGVGMPEPLETLC